MFELLVVGALLANTCAQRSCAHTFRSVRHCLSPYHATQHTSVDQTSKGHANFTESFLDTLPIHLCPKGGSNALTERPLMLRRSQLARLAHAQVINLTKSRTWPHLTTDSEAHPSRLKDCLNHILWMWLVRSPHVDAVVLDLVAKLLRVLLDFNRGVTANSRSQFLPYSRDRKTHDSQRNDRILRFFLRPEIGQFYPHFVLSGLPNANAKSQRFSYAISQIAPLPPVTALNRNFKSQIAARYAAFWHAIPQIALALVETAPVHRRFCSSSWSNTSW